MIKSIFSESYWRLSFSIALLSIATIITAFMNPTLMRLFFSRGSYLLLLILFFYWLQSLHSTKVSLDWSIRKHLRQHGWVWFGIFSFCTMIFLSSPPYLRVLSDEATLIAVSQWMALATRCELVTSAVEYGFALRPLDFHVPGRPLLFPFFVHLFHLLSGYRVENAFALNFVTLTSLFGAIYFLFKKTLGAAWGICAILLIAAQPVLIEAATSAGFDLFNLLFMVLSFACLMFFLTRPDAVSFQLLWIHLLLLSHIRYESIAYFFVTLGFLLLFRKLRWEYFKNSLLYAWTPLLLIPLFWQRIMAVPPYQELSNEAPFALSYFWNHSLIFFKQLAWGKPAPLGAWVINMLGVAGLVNFLYLFFSKQWLRSKPARQAFWIIASWIVFLWILMAAYYYGNIVSHSCSRFFIVFLFLLSIFCTLLFHRLGLFLKRPFTLCLFSLLIFLPHHSFSMQHGYTNSLDMPRRHRQVLHFLQSQTKRHLLIITDRPIHYIIRGYGAIHFSQASKFEEKLRQDFKNRLYETIFVVQEIHLESGEATPDTHLEGDFQTQPVFEIQNQDQHFIRISKLSIPDL